MPTVIENEPKIDNQINVAYQFQKELVAWNEPKQLWNKSRQIGFSLGLAMRAFGKGLENDAFEAMYLSVGERQASEWLDKIRVFLLLKHVEPVTDKHTEIRLSNGSRFIALPQNPATVRSYSPDEIYMDEFAHYKQDREMLIALTPSLSRKDKQRTLIIGSTPFGKLGEFYRLWDSDNTYAKKQIDIYEAIKQGVPLDAEACRALSPDEQAFQQEYLCQFVDDATSFFPYEVIKACWNESLTNMTFESMAALKSPLFAGYDPGKLQDSGVFTIVEMTHNKAILRHKKKWDGVPYTKQLEYIYEAMQKAKITKLNTDRTGVGEKLYEDLCNKFSSRVNGITFTNAVKEKMIIDLKVLFQDNKIEIPYDMSLTNQLHSLQRSILPSKKVRYAHPSGKHDDEVWALALATMSGGSPKVITVRRLGGDL